MSSSNLLTASALDILLHDLRAYGNAPSRKQVEALEDVLSTYTGMVEGRLNGRLAFPLATGQGKTQSIVAWCTALNRMGRLGEFGIVVCAGKVEALCDLKRKLVEHGLPEDQVGLLHSYKHDPALGSHDLKVGFASLPSTQGNNLRPILLVTHNRVRGTGGVEKYDNFKGETRRLVIWDESLIVSNSRSLQLEDLESQLAALAPYVRRDGQDSPALAQAHAFLKECHKAAKDDLEGQQNFGREPQPLHFPSRSSLELERYAEELKACRRKRAGKLAVDELLELLEFSVARVRVIPVSQGEGLITYDIVVSQELENIVILDASHNIRELVALDQSITTAGRHPDGDIVDYSNVTMHFLRHRSGRSSMEQLFGARKRENRPVSLELVEVIKDIPTDQGIIIFTFKPKGRINIPDILKGDLQAQGIDTGAMLPIGKPRFVFLTWGSETSLSEYSYCSNVLFAGVLQRSELDIASAMAGQRDDLLLTPTTREIRQVVLSEASHCVYQAMCRGSCRVVQGEITKEMRVWLFFNDTRIKDNLDMVMPGMTWRPWIPRHLKKHAETLVEALASKVVDYLMALDATVERVSVKKLKTAVAGAAHPAKDTITNAMSMAADQTPGWIMDGRSFQRVTAALLFGEGVEPGFSILDVSR